MIAQVLSLETKNKNGDVGMRKKKGTKIFYERVRK